ncbi:MAG TPA: RdgB/HAM1 family non-canonical purine NTP pyrophosphatase [Steroidobacteraceae bacterium]|nr:RdgB/HAM1 family non-canonical purine NTP pyrophosphatase [Steroidobacteraceae bacterium]HQW08599.1 RdgB/HAM1 family non-canonical purine NTP pyrophosphatase [Steroidobacteraceae bacterium]HQX46392.1 RdgB/HAM1 family non-canonical purine NTP pyrophosphatase [Steroidobacteraceae bacterium]
MRVVVATGNRGKLGELTALLAPLGVDLLPQSAYGVEPPPETGTTFLSNALIKARHAARVAQLPAVADDSGLEVDALGGAPGVYSARYAGEGSDAAANNAKLLKALTGVPPEKRRARFRAIIVFVRSAVDPHPLVGEGVWEGRIALAPRGIGGFGFDPLFEPLDSTRTAAELTSDDKNARSHRGAALRALVAQWPR